MLYLSHAAPARSVLAYLPGTRRSAVRMCGAAVGSDSDSGRYVATSTDDVFFVSPLPSQRRRGRSRCGTPPPTTAASSRSGSWSTRSIYSPSAHGASTAARRPSLTTRCRGRVPWWAKRAARRRV
eukprot:scaffold40873_cov63-Phaeocystis_antarctica.AAC.3